jgi:sensor histidine kinase YesM
MAKISDAISQKISQIQAKQREIDAELYAASKPPLEAELQKLKQELRTLEMQRDQLQTQQAARDMAKPQSQPSVSPQQVSPATQ